MNVETKKVFFVKEGKDAGSLMMDVRIEPEIGKEGGQPEKFMGMPSRATQGYM